MPKKQRRYFPKRRRAATNDGPSEDPFVESEARRLAETLEPFQIREHLDQCQMAYDEADHNAEINPGGQALNQYRNAARALAAAQRAMEMASAGAGR